MEVLAPYRQSIDALDEQIIALLAQRMAIVRDVAQIKAQHGIPAVLPERVAQVLNQCEHHAVQKGLEPQLIRTLYTLIIDYACALEEQTAADIHTKTPSSAAG